MNGKMEHAGEYLHSNHRYKGNFSNNNVSFLNTFCEIWLFTAPFLLMQLHTVDTEILHVTQLIVNCWCETIPYNVILTKHKGLQNFICNKPLLSFNQQWCEMNTICSNDIIRDYFQWLICFSFLYFSHVDPESFCLTLDARKMVNTNKYSR